ncbi:MAG TPA: hypothetical protein EYN06_09910 [Myxococcales bacterium]|nr:hypothetical protein [Myxococcales bacterium]HIN86784.1 hypothetical protein [Myxococcales bacterium]
MKSLYLALVIVFIFPVVNPSVASAEEAVSEFEHPAGYRHRHVNRRRRVVRVGPGGPTGLALIGGTGGLYVGAGVVGNYFLQTDSEVSKTYKGGGGLELMWGYRLAPFAAIEFNFMTVFQSTQTTGSQKINNGSINSVGVDGKFFLVPGYNRIEPYVQVGAGVYMLSENFEERLTGAGIRLGGGVDVQLNPIVSIGGRLLYHGFQVDNSENDYYGIATESAFLNTVTLQGNVKFHF